MTNTQKPGGVGLNTRSTLPLPLVEPQIDVRDLSFMPIDILRLRRSKAWLIAKRNPELGFYMMNLWTAAFHEVPAGSLPDDDNVWIERALCDDPEIWMAARDKLRHGWVLCSDGRWYHPVVCEKAMAGWSGILKMRARIDRRLEVESGFWAAIRSQIFARDDYMCRYCGARGVKLECDHVIPRALGGKTEPENLVTACLQCNRSKGAKPLHVWINGSVA